MFPAGDEFGNTQMGNNNAYCQDNEIAWLNWSEPAYDPDMFDFVSRMIDFRKRHPILRHPTTPAACGFPDLSFHHGAAGNDVVSFHDRQIGIMFGGRRPLGDIEHWDVSTPDESGWADDFVFLAVNAHWEAHTQELPPLPEGYTWHMFMHTFRKDPFVTEESFDGHTAVIGPRSAAVFTGVPIS